MPAPVEVRSATRAEGNRNVGENPNVVNRREKDSRKQLTAEDLGFIVPAQMFRSPSIGEGRIGNG